jgi:hypothetical protein
MTSNLGAEEHKKASLGFDDAAPAAERVREHYLRAVRRFVRPELFNRLDRVVPFNPLNEELLRRIARRELDLLERRDGVRYRDLHLELTDHLAAYLTARGYNPRYGARPLKRAMERELLAPLADALNHFAHETPLAAEIEIGEERLRVRAKGRGKPAGGDGAADVPAAGPEAPGGLNHPRVAEAARECVGLRREAFRLQQSHAVLDIDNTIFRLAEIEKRVLRGKAVAQQEQERLRRLAVLRKLRERVRRLTEGAADLEERVLVPCYTAKTTTASVQAQRGGAVDPLACVQEAELLNEELASLVFDLYALNFGASDLVTLTVYSEEPEWLFYLARGYHGVAKRRGCAVSLFTLQSLTERIYQQLAEGVANPLPAGEFLVGIGEKTDRQKLKSSDDTVLRAAPIPEPAAFLGEPLEGVLGLALRVAGPLAFPLLAPEDGLHVFRSDGERHACLVHTLGQDFGPTFAYTPPQRIDRRGAIGKQPQRRQFDLDRDEIADGYLEARLHLSSRNLEETLSSLIHRRLVVEAGKWLGL